MKHEDSTKVIKTCYSHIGGKFGNRLFVRFEEPGWISKDSDSKNFRVTKLGEKEFTKLGLKLNDLEQ